jgi:hypothetical protein
LPSRPPSGSAAVTRNCGSCASARTGRAAASNASSMRSRAKAVSSIFGCRLWPELVKEALRRWDRQIRLQAIADEKDFPPPLRGRVRVEGNSACWDHPPPAYSHPPPKSSPARGIIYLPQARMVLNKARQAGLLEIVPLARGKDGEKQKFEKSRLACPCLGPATKRSPIGTLMQRSLR